jgi:hypothetical protein
VLFVTLTTSKSAQATDFPTDSLISIPLADYKFVQAWAEFGLACESATLLLENQIIKDGQRVELMATELDKSYEARKRLKFIASLLAVGLASSIIYIIFG